MFSSMLILCMQALLSIKNIQMKMLKKQNYIENVESRKKIEPKTEFGEIKLIL